MPTTETFSVPRHLRSEVDRAASGIWNKALKALSGKPGAKEIKERVERGMEGVYTFASDQGNITLSFLPSSEAKVISITRAWQEKDGPHRESTHALSEIATFGIWKFGDLSSLQYEKDGVRVFDREAIEGSVLLIERVSQARPLPQE